MCDLGGVAKLQVKAYILKRNKAAREIHKNPDPEYISGKGTFPT
jgi:hypothetical protein